MGRNHNSNPNLADAALPDGFSLVLEYVNGAVRMAMAERENGIHVSGQEICRMVLQLAFDLNGNSATLMLNELGLGRSEDVGNAICELIDRGVINMKPGDSIEEFEGLFDTAEEPSSWLVCWDVDGSGDVT